MEINNNNYICPYTNEQIDRYIDRIGLPKELRRIENPPRDLSLLTTLKTHHLATFPFESVSLHYSTDRKVSLNPFDLYRKFLDQERGGYCMEQNWLFLHMLKGLGFDAYPTGARVRSRRDGVPFGDFLGWVHMVNIVTLEGDTNHYMVDVGFGGDGPTKPLPLSRNVITRNIATQDLRLLCEALPRALHRGQQTWIYQTRNQPSLDWVDTYCFSELEFLPQDFEVMNYYTSSHPTSPMANIVIAVKFLRDGTGLIYGKEMLAGAELKRNTGGRTELIKTCKIESERLEILKTIFNIQLNEEEQQAIRGRASALAQE